MPEGHGYPNESEQERKQRIKKLKARTSKMRIAVIKKNPDSRSKEYRNKVKIRPSRCRFNLNKLMNTKLDLII